MRRFSTVTVREPAAQWVPLGLVPGAILLCNGVHYRIAGSCKGRKRLLLQRRG